MNAVPLDIIDLVVKASALLAAAGVVDALLGRRGSAAARCLVWSLAIAGLLVLPMASYALPRWPVRIPVARTAVPSAVHSGFTTPARSLTTAGATRFSPAIETADAEFRLKAETTEFGSVASAFRRNPGAALPLALAVLAALYAGGVLMLMARIGREPFVLRRLTRDAREVADPAWRRLFDEAARQSRVGRPVRLLQSAGELMPMTYGTWHPTLVLPASADAWTDDRRRAVLLHELAHVARRDCFVQRLASLACALYWPHPGIWWAARRLRAQRELACDDLVLAAGAGPREYAGHLLDLARSLGTVPAPATALGMARARQLEHRLLAVLDAARNRTALGRGGLVVAIAASIVVLLPMAALRATVVPVDRPAEALSADPLAKAATPPSSRVDLQPATTVTPDVQSKAKAQGFEGVWEIRLSREAGSVNLTLRRLQGSHGRTLPLARFEGLTASQISAVGAVRFTSRRDAGTLAFDGVCRNGLCGGTYGFEPNAAFAAELARRGIGAPSPKQQYDMAVADVGIAFLDELSALGYQKPDLPGLVRAAEHGVDPDYVREMAGLGYRLGTLDALIKLRDHGVDPEYVRGMAANGFPRLSIDDLLRARNHGVDPEYIKGMRDLGYGQTDLARLITLRNNGVDPGYVRGMAANGFPRLSIDDLVRARNHGVDPEYIKGMRDLGYGQTDLARLITLRNHGVDPAYTRGMAALGFKDIPLDKLVALRGHGVDPDYVRGMQQAGYKLGLDELTRTRGHGIDPDYISGLAALGYKGLPLDTLIRMRGHGVDPEFVRRLQQRGSGRLSVDELIQRRSRGDDGSPEAAAREVAASLRVVWNSFAARVARLRS